MATIKIKFSPSINIIRDNNYAFNYITTKNSTEIFADVLNDVSVGIKSHVIIGAYGTGKSSFLLAFKQTLEKRFIHFKGYQKSLNSIPDFEFLTVVGESTSLENFFAKKYNLGKGYTTNEIIKALDKEYKTLKKRGKGLAILIDEFGKFLEYAAKNNPESELYFIQQLAEWVNDTDNDTLLITTLHQDFSAYSYNLNSIQRKEWDKVKGRLRELPFNEPVEQLLFLASERINEKFPIKVFDKNFDKLFDCIKEANAFPLKDYFTKDFSKKLYPFDILSAAILTLSLQKYGQNERSLFSFIESKDHLGISEFDTKKLPYFAIPQVYNYLINGYYSFLTNKYNPDFTQWSAIRKSLEQIDGFYKDATAQSQAEELLKVVGLLNIFATSSAKLTKDFYHQYAKWALTIKNPEEIIKQLEKNKIIKYVKHSERYVFVEGTDLDIELAIDDAGRLVEKVTHVVNYLNQYFEFPYISAKAVYYEKGTPRFFQFKLSETPITNSPEGEVDGFINLVFSDETSVAKRVEECSKSGEEAILYGVYKNTVDIKNVLFEIQKVNKVIENYPDDKIALNLLNEERDIKIKLLNHYVLSNLYSDKGNITWYWKGKRMAIANRQKFNQLLSTICEEVYPHTPVYRNELNNRTKLSGQVASARNKLVEKLLTDLDSPNIGFQDNQFPPERSIYLTLLRKTGIHQISDGFGLLSKPADESFLELWTAGNSFLESSKNRERNLTEFIDILSCRPFKLKQGLIDFWLPIFLLARSDEFALFHEPVDSAKAYVPELDTDVLALINKKPEMFTLKAFDVAGIKLELFNRYRVFLNQAENHKPSNKVFIQTIKPFMVLYKDLQEYSKKTNRLEKTTLALRNVITTVKDPEKAFFEDFPNALGYSLAELQKKPALAGQFIKHLQEAIRQLRTSYDALVDRFENFLVSEIIGKQLSFPEYKDALWQRYIGLKTHMLLQHQKSFYTKMQSELDDRKAWLGGIAQACINKPLNSISDEDEAILYEKLKDITYELDNLSEVNKEQIDESNEEVVKVEITSFVRGFTKNLLRIPKGKGKEIDLQVKTIKSNLGKDKKLNIVILTKLLQELLNNE